MTGCLVGDGYFEGLANGRFPIGLAAWVDSYANSYHFT